MRTAAAIVALAATAAVASAHSGSHSAASRKRHSEVKRASGYQLTGYYAGQDFLNLFDFATGEATLLVSGGSAVLSVFSRSSKKDANASPRRFV